MALKSMRMAAPRAAACGRAAVRRYSMASRGLGQVRFQARAVRCAGATCSSSRAARAGSTHSGRADCRSASNSRTSALMDFTTCHFRRSRKAFSITGSVPSVMR